MEPALHIWSKLGILPLVQWRLEQNSLALVQRLVNEQDATGYTPLDYAVEHGHSDIVEFLLSNGAAVNDLAVFIAASEGQGELLRLLLRRGNVNARSICGDTALYDAAGQGLEHIVQTLLEFGADVNAGSDATGILADRHCARAVSVAAANGHESTVRLLLPQTRDAGRYLGEALIFSAMADREEMVRLLLDYVPRFGALSDSEGRLLNFALSIVTSVSILDLILHRHDIDANTLIVTRTSKTPQSMISLATSERDRTKSIFCSNGTQDTTSNERTE
jgi:ankyrin repeat protein